MITAKEFCETHKNRYFQSEQYSERHREMVYAIMEEFLQAQHEDLIASPVASRFLVVFSTRHNEYQYMKTVWSDEDINDVGIWKILSEHSTKEDARIERDRLVEEENNEALAKI